MRNFKILINAFAICSLATSTVVAQPQSARVETDITRLLDSVRTANDLPALAAAFVTKDSIVAIGVSGFRRYHGTVPVTINDHFHLGSDLKAMTAGLIGVLVDRGKLQWTSTLAELFPELAGTMRDEYKTITVRELLSHQSGLVPNATIPFNQATEREQRLAFAKWVLEQTPASPRGKYSYANSNYTLAGAIAERLMNASYEQLMNDLLFKPIGMTTVSWGAAGTAGKEDQPWQYRFNGSNRIEVAPGPNSDNPPVMGPAGRANMSIGDWALWIQTVLRAEAGMKSPWTRETSHVLTSAQVVNSSTDGYAMGWLTTKRGWAGPTGRTLTHAGSNTMNYALAWLAPDAGFGMIVVTNQAGDAAPKATDGMIGRLLQWRT
ncbi:MAG: serine hydrolase domain-containing protein, partial [Gemmatimonadaceae bacterium]